MIDLPENNRAFAAAIKRGDWLAAASAYAENALLQPPSSDAVEGREHIAAYWRAGVDAGVTEIELTPLSNRRSDTIAVELGTYEMRLEPAEGGAVVDRGRYLLVHECQRDGSWRYAVEMFSPDSSAEALTR